jgi:hypothetical protein
MPVRQRSTSQIIKVKCVSLKFRVCSISFKSFEGFLNTLAQMFTTTRQCAERIIQACLSKVKVTNQGQMC